MSSRRTISAAPLALALVFALVLNLGCAREKDPSTEPVSFSLKSTSDCLGNAGQTFSDYVHARLAPKDIEAFWGCTAKAVSDYQRLTIGDIPGNAYSPQALRHFVEHYFLRDYGISDPLLKSLMELKRVLVSGTTTQVTQDELNRLQKFLGEMQALSLELNPYIRVLALQKAAASDAEIQEANHHLQLSIRHLTDWISANQQDYTFAQMRELLVAIKGWGGSHSAETDQLYATIQKAVELLPDVKHLLVNGSPTAIGADEWHRVVTHLVRGYGFFVSAHYAFAQDLNSGLVRDAIPNTLNDVSDMLREAVQARSDAMIPQNEFAQLFRKIEQTQVLPPEFSAQALSAAWTWFLNRPLGRVLETGFTQVQVQHLRDQAVMWKNLSAYVHGQAAISTPELALFQSVRDSSVPLEWDAQGRLLFPVTGARQWTKEAQLQLVWPFVILNWIKTSYAGANASYLTPEQVSTAVGEVLPLLQDFGWMKGTPATIGARILREADLFTSASNGNQLLDMSEAVRYVAFVASAYRASEVWLSEADRLCGNRAAACVRRLPLTSDTVFAPFPRLTAALKQQKDPELALKRYLQSAEETILGQDVQGEFSTGDLLQTWVIYSYIETFLRNYDQDNTETITLPEAERAYQTFGPTLETLLGAAGVPPNEVLDFFTFLMKYGDTPNMFGGQILYIHWKRHQAEWQVAADRTILMGILNQLSKL